MLSEAGTTYFVQLDGVKTYSNLVGFVLSWFGRTVKIHDNSKYNTYYVNTTEVVQQTMTLIQTLITFSEPSMASNRNRIFCKILIATYR